MERPLCNCGNLCKPNGVSKVTGETKYYKVCSSCLRKRNKQGNIENSTLRTQRAILSATAKKGYCESCGFIPEHPCQLDLDHIDEDRTNNDPSNHQTLCANCHRLKTYKNSRAHQKPL